MDEADEMVSALKQDLDLIIKDYPKDPVEHCYLPRRSQAPSNNWFKITCPNM